MPRNVINIRFNLRDPKSTNETPVNAIIRYNGQKFTYPTSEKINPKDWQGDKSKKNPQRAKSSFLSHVEFNARLSNIYNVVNNVFRQYKNDNNSEVPTWNKFKGLLDINLKRAEQAPKDFISFIEKFIIDSKNKTNPATGERLSNSTIKKYKTTLTHLKDFIVKRRKKLDFEDIDMQFHDEYKAFLISSYDLATNSIGKDTTIIKKFMTAATQANVTKNLAFKTFRSISEKSDAIYLTEKELAAIFELDLSNNEKLDRVRDRFLIGCYTGLRFSDYSKFNPKDIKDNIIQIETKKTRETVKIPLHPIVKSILAKYDNTLPKSITNQKTNEYLKELGALIPLLNEVYDKKMTKGGERRTTTYKRYQLIATHTARRSFATNLYESGFPSISIMKITGHRTESAFLRYIVSHRLTPSCE